MIATDSWSQAYESKKSSVYINILITADKTIYVENDKTDLTKIESKISELLKKVKFQPDREIIVQIYADQTLKMELLTDLSSELYQMNLENMQVRRYLLNTMNFELDGENWLKKIENIPKNQG